MPTCGVCSHDERRDIEAAIVSGKSRRAVASQYGLSKDGVARHEANHLSPALKGVVTKREVAGATSALDRLEHLYGRASRVLDAAEAEGKASLSLAAVRELRGLVETLARITGELDDSPKVAVVNLSSSAEWQTTRAAMLDVLREYPDAGRAVAARLVELEA